MKKAELEAEALRLAGQVDRLRKQLRDQRRRTIKAVEALAKHENGRLFVANEDGTYTCEDCFSPELRARLGDDGVEVWEEGSDGWTGPVMCHDCKLSIPVYVNGNEPEEPKQVDRQGITDWVVARAVALNKSGRPGPAFADAIARAEYDAELAIIDELRTLLGAW